MRKLFIAPHCVLFTYAYTNITIQLILKMKIYLHVNKFKAILEMFKMGDSSKEIFSSVHEATKINH